MSKMINYGIDLGTTNSLIAKFEKGEVEVFKNPNGHKETLPSIVGYRNDRILVGDQVRTFLDRDPKSVISRFKRRMGTTESYRINSIQQSRTPIELSAEVLKELKTFIHTGEQPEATVITIPASFDHVQSNATIEAGRLAGFKQVLLLQEPIAASLAYANREKSRDLRNSQWIVYDLGGGTFDVALVRIMEGELKVLDHEGNNFLGGTDFDMMLVEKLIVPHIEKRGSFTDLTNQLKSHNGKYNRLWYKLLFQAEQAKIELSSRTSTEIDLSTEDDLGDPIDELLVITRSDYESLIKDPIETTVTMLKNILTRNKLRPKDLEFVLMVGGATYTPYIRKRVEELMEIPVVTGISPTNAIVIGAAYFASGKEIDLKTPFAKTSPQPGRLKIKTSFPRNSQESEEIFSARIDGELNGLFYRITRDDGGYDSGLRPLTQRISEDLPLQPETFNLFYLKIYDQLGNLIQAESDPIQISQGKYSVAGQQLPQDLSLAKDLDSGDTTLERIFAKNHTLPAVAKKTVEASRTIVQGSEDTIHIIVVEGPTENHLHSNQKIGHLKITGKELSRTLHRGTDIELIFEISESRELRVQAHISASGQEFVEVYKLENRPKIEIADLKDQAESLRERLERERSVAYEHENTKVLDELLKIRAPVNALNDTVATIPEDDVTDARYQLENELRKLSQQITNLTSSNNIERGKYEYFVAKTETEETIDAYGKEHEHRQLKDIIDREQLILNSNNLQKIEALTAEMYRLNYQILGRTPGFLIEWFEFLTAPQHSYNDPVQAGILIESGKRHIESKEFERLREVNIRLMNLIPDREKKTVEGQKYTGIQ